MEGKVSVRLNHDCYATIGKQITTSSLHLSC